MDYANKPQKELNEEIEVFLEDMFKYSNDVIKYISSHIYKKIEWEKFVRIINKQTIDFINNLSEDEVNSINNYFFELQYLIFISNIKKDCLKNKILCSLNQNELEELYFQIRYVNNFIYFKLHPDIEREMKSVKDFVYEKDSIDLSLTDEGMYPFNTRIVERAPISE